MAEKSCSTVKPWSGWNPSALSRSQILGRRPTFLQIPTGRDAYTNFFGTITPISTTASYRKASIPPTKKSVRSFDLRIRVQGRDDSQWVLPLSMHGRGFLRLTHHIVYGWAFGHVLATCYDVPKISGKRWMCRGNDRSTSQSALTLPNVS